MVSSDSSDVYASLKDGSPENQNDAELAARDAELAARDAMIKSILTKLSLE